jgi:hypothetical protein
VQNLQHRSGIECAGFGDAACVAELAQL